ncbi:MAG: PCRF domain-containing protein, partial [Candidatus Hodgkinia cicadicola]
GVKFASDRKIIMLFKSCKLSAKGSSEVKGNRTADSSVWLDIRSGVGGTEACSFASELLRMYERFPSKWIGRSSFWMPIEAQTDI